MKLNLIIWPSLLNWYMDPNWTYNNSVDDDEGAAGNMFVLPCHNQ